MGQLWPPVLWVEDGALVADGGGRGREEDGASVPREVVEEETVCVHGARGRDGGGEGAGRRATSDELYIQTGR